MAIVARSSRFAQEQDFISAALARLSQAAIPFARRINRRVRPARRGAFLERIILRRAPKSRSSS
jgi:hypothetical protein